MSILALLLALTVPPCATEDSTYCYWDAQLAGNGQGTSFVQLGDMALY